MNEQELLDSLHDGNILTICQDGSRVIVGLDYVDRWEPQEQEGRYRLVYIPACLVFEDAEIVTQTGDYARPEELPDWHAARIILWVDAVDDIYHFITPGDGSLAIRAEAVRLECLTGSEVSGESQTARAGVPLPRTGIR